VTLPLTLPTFNSYAIESRLVSLRNSLPSLTRRFLYLNDDMLFGAALRTPHFFSGRWEGEQRGE
jgi:hypothetical protein